MAPEWLEDGRKVPDDVMYVSTLNPMVKAISNRHDLRILSN